MRSKIAVSRRWQTATTILALLAAMVSISCGGITHAGQTSDLALNSTTIDFGSVAVGGTKNSVLTVTNSSPAGGLSVTITQLSATGTGFTVTAAAMPLVLAPGQSSPVTITFTPKSAGAATGTLTIALDGGLEPTMVPLTGTGVGAAQLVAGPATLAFGNVSVGSSASLNGTLTAGNSAITVSSGTVSGQGYQLSGISFPATVAAGSSVTYSVTFTPQATGSTPGSVSFASNAANSPATQTFTGTGTQVATGTPPPAAVGNLAVAPATLAFGSVTVGSNKKITGTLTAGTTSITVTGATVSGTGYSLSGITFPATIAAGTTVTYGVTFAPQSAASLPGSISFASNAANSPSVESFTGTGAAPAVASLTVAPATLAFGSVAVGSSKNMTGTITAGNTAVAVASAAWTGQGYSVSGISFPLTVAAGTSVSYTVSFTPATAGSTPGGISFVSNAANSPSAQTFTGTGTQTAPAVQHTVNLSWAASTSTVTGYNVYRGTTNGGPYTLLNSSPSTATSYADSTVASGTTYFYVVTSVGTDSVESSYSNQVTAVVPTP